MTKKESKLSKIIAKAPRSSGIYKFLDADGNLIYVGKAKDLRKRLRSYIRPGARHGVKNEKMLDSAKSVEWVETNSEVEALILEDNLIKENQPKYNILLKDSKTFQYIKVTIQKDYPEVLTVRHIERDGAKYFGPKTSGMDVRRVMESVKRIFKLCSLHNISLNPGGTILKGAKVAVKTGGTAATRPCLDYHIKRCNGPCAGMITPKEYLANINGAVEFLSGNFQNAIKTLKEQMKNYADARKFERAGALRDQINAIERIAQKQLITDTNFTERDIIAYVDDLGKNYFVLFQIRGGRLINQEKFISEGGDTPAEIMEAFLLGYYGRAADIPREVISSVEIPERKQMESFISERKSGKVNILFPKLGRKDRLIQLAEKNARSFAEQSRVRWMADQKGEKALEQLTKALKLDKPPKRIECYDISHLGGTETIGSMVVFKNGEPAVGEYRQFRLRSSAGKNDDYMSIEEVITRRLNYLPAKLPENYKIGRMKKTEGKILNKIYTDLKYTDYKPFFVIRRKKKIVAAGQLISHDDKYDQISHLWVDEKERGKKLGHFLMKKLISRSKLRRVYKVCRPELEEYYLKMGFELIRKAPPEISRHVVSKKPLYLAYQKKKVDTSFSSTPDLIVIDGGKGQLHTAHNVLFAKGLGIPIISLAKKLEEVFIPGKSDPIDLPCNSEASYLLQRLRDEAHRFAVTANRSSRDKKMIKSALDMVPGVGPMAKKKLLTHFGSAAKIREASQVQLEQIVGEKIAESIRNFL